MCYSVFHGAIDNIELRLFPLGVNTDAGTMAALYFKTVRSYDLVHRDILVASQQDIKFTVEQFDVGTKLSLVFNYCSSANFDFLFTLAASCLCLCDGLC